VKVAVVVQRYGADINGGAAHLIKKGERVAIMAFGLTDKPITARKVVLDDKNHVIRGGR
jgi:aspartate 1-decarboxylase